MQIVLVIGIIGLAIKVVEQVLEIIVIKSLRIKV
jgi:hypothetical protein